MPIVRVRKPLAQLVAVILDLPVVWWESTTVAAVLAMKAAVMQRRVAPGTVPMAVVSQTQPAAAAAKRAKCVMRKRGFVFATRHAAMHVRRDSSVMVTLHQQPAVYACAIQVAPAGARQDKRVIRIITQTPAGNVIVTQPAAAAAMRD